MPDTNTPHRHSTGSSPVESWQDAFAALPLESPPAAGWEAVATQLPARQRRWPAWLAIAAALALAIGLPLRWAWQPSDAPVAGTELASGQSAHPANTPTQAAQAQQPDASASEGSAGQPIADESATPTFATSDPVGHATAATTPRRSDRQTANTAIADKRTPTPDRSATSAAATQPSIQNQAELAQLHVESARLEALLALTRDESVSSAGAALLSEHFDDQLGTIDAALMQPALTDRQRLGLWRQRVSALRQLAGFSSTQRVLAAYGQRDDARLVGIY